jgi:hypothetical protein
LALVENSFQSNARVTASGSIAIVGLEGSVENIQAKQMKPEHCLHNKHEPAVNQLIPASNAS